MSAAAAPAPAAPPPRRRSLELPLRIVPGEAPSQPAAPPEPAAARVNAYRLPGRAADAAFARPDGDGDAFLLDYGAEGEVLLVAGAEVRPLPRGAGGREMLERAERGAAAWARERLRVTRRLQLPEQLLAYAGQLGGARTVEAVQQALVQHAPRIAGGYCALLFAGGAGEPLRPLAVEPLHHRLPPVALPPSPRLGRPCLVTAEDALSGTGSPFTPLAPVFAELGACTLAAVPVGPHGVLFLVERRADRLWEPEDWDLLRAVTGQAEAALERVRLFEEVRDLSLTDPLTGLANRRQLRLVLERSLAAARRGEGLALALVDLDDFKAVNEERGHLGGDRVLRRVAGALAAEARGSDLVARYGGDEFLLVLPGGTALSADSLLRRVRARLDGEVSLSAGVAEYGPAASGAEELIEAADRDLFRAKQALHAPPGRLPRREGVERRVAADRGCDALTARPG